MQADEASSTRQSPAGPREDSTPQRDAVRPLSPAAQRALAEAAARRAEQAAKVADRPPERHGRGGLDPTRFGDWEVNGLASDF